MAFSIPELNIKFGLCIEIEFWELQALSSKTLEHSICSANPVGLTHWILERPGLLPELPAAAQHRM